MTLDIRQLDPTDLTQVRAWWEVGHAAMSTRPVDLWPDWEISRHAIPQPDSDHRMDYVGAFDGDAMVASALVFLPLRDNTHMGDVAVYVPPPLRGRGHGSAMLAHCEAVVREAGRTTILAEVRAPLDDDGPDAAWAVSRGYAVANVDGIKVADLAATADLLPGLEAQAAERRGDYVLAAWPIPVPEEHLESLAAAMSQFLLDIPLGDLDLEPEVWTPERIRRTEARRLAQRRDVLTVAALTPDGRVAGYTSVYVSPHAPRVCGIGETIVLAEHRGHRLGLGMKVLLHQRLTELHPGAELIVTGNATTNSWMNAVNEQLGYAPLDRSLEMQKVIG